MWSVQDLSQKEFLLESRQIKLLSELQTIYPIQRLDNQEYAIRGVELPYDLNSTSKDDEHVSSALGYVAHLVFMLSKYLQVGQWMGDNCKSRKPVFNGITGRKDNGGVGGDGGDDSFFHPPLVKCFDGW